MRDVRAVVRQLTPVSLSVRGWLDLKDGQQKLNQTEESHEKHVRSRPSQSGPHRARIESCGRLRAPGSGRRTDGHADDRAGRPARSSPTHPCPADTPARQDSTGADGTDRETTRALDEREMVTATGPRGTVVIGPDPAAFAAWEKERGRRD